MKGIIPICLKEMVIEKYGIEAWGKCLLSTGATSDMNFVATSDIDDNDVVKLIDALCTSLSISRQEAADAFGEYWVCSFSQRVYSHYYRKYKNAREFILAIDSVHVDSTRTIENASPPRFDYAWKDGRTLVVTYKSKRNLIDLFIGLAKGVGKHYGESLHVKKIDSKNIQIVFD